jgi:hypothetical protein
MMEVDLVPKPGSKWLHKNGTEYTVAVVTNLGTTKPGEYTPTVVYSSANDVWWSRPLDRWHGNMTPSPEHSSPVQGELMQTATPPVETVTLTGKTNKGKQRVREFGKSWRVWIRWDHVLFSSEPGPWLMVSPLGSTQDSLATRWVNENNDVDFVVTFNK